MRLVDTFDRVEKALVDLRGVTPEEARLTLSASPVVVRIGNACGPAEHAAVLTLANLAPRVFKRPLQIEAAGGTLECRLRVRWPASTLGEALRQLGCEQTSAPRDDGTALLLGGGPGPGQRISHAGWSARVSPCGWGGDLAGTEGNVLAGIIGAGLALSELFSMRLGLSPESGRRPAEFSLWRPDLSPTDQTAIGPDLAYLPSEAWVLGLGHVGQGFLWALSMLPFESPGAVALVLQDFDRAVSANVGSQCLMSRGDAGKRKTRLCREFLERRGFDPAIIDARFDDRTRRHADQPAVAVCAFDGQGPRWLLDEAGFDQVIVAGVGGRVSDFDEVQVHGLPLAGCSAKDIWTPGRDDGFATRLAAENRFYRSVLEQHRCGELELAGTSVAVPFVGAVAGAMLAAELVRTLTGGPQYSFTRLHLRSVDERRVRPRSAGQDLSPRYVQGFQRVAASGT